ncbi:MAG: DUF4416 family protein [Deltaproteobacteria bacterium]|nr:DUF4416 family protein [Deltaproteobacteria bacterium]
MSLPKAPKPAKLVIGLFMKEKRLIEQITAELIEVFGSIDMVSPWFPFDYTDYYESEMNAPLFRRMLAFKELIKQSSLADIKNITNEIESNYSKEEKRLVNIDPGYMLQERFVLATGKNFAHRIYIGKKIYADLTLIFTKGEFKKLPWTYPDYSDKNMLSFLRQVRNKYVADLKNTQELKK